MYSTKKIHMPRCFYDIEHGGGVARILELIKEKDTIEHKESITPEGELSRKKIIEEIHSLLRKQVASGNTLGNLSSEDTRTIRSLLEKTYFDGGEREKEYQSLKEEVGLSSYRDAILELVPKDWKEERDILESLHHTNIRSLLSLLSLPEGKRQAIIDEYGTNEEDMRTPKNLKANRKVLSLLEASGYRADGTLGAREAVIVGEFLRMTISDSSRLRRVLKPFIEGITYGISPVETLRSLQIHENLQEDGIYDYLSSLPLENILQKKLKSLLKNLSSHPESLENFWSRVGYPGIKTPGELLLKAKEHPELRSRLYELIHIGLNAGYSVEDICRPKKDESERLGIPKVLESLLKGSLENLSSTDTATEKDTRRAILKGISDEVMMRSNIDFEGRFRLLSESLFANIDKSAPGIGVGLTFEIFSQNLTVHPGIGIGPNGVVFGGLSVRYTPPGIKSETPESTEYSVPSVGIGALKSGFMPFFEMTKGSMKKTKGIDAKGVETVHMDDTMVTIMPMGGMIMRGSMDDTLMSIAGKESILVELMALLSGTDISEATLSTENLKKLVGSLDGVTIDSQYLEKLSSDLIRVRNYYELSHDNTSILKKFHILRGYARTETQILQGELVTNDVDSRSMTGGAVGIGISGTHLGPVGNVILTKHSRKDSLLLEKFTLNPVGMITEKSYRVAGEVQRRNTLIGIGAIPGGAGQSEEIPGGDSMVEHGRNMTRMDTHLEGSIVTPPLDMSRVIPRAIEQKKENGNAKEP